MTLDMFTILISMIHKVLVLVFSLKLLTKIKVQQLWKAVGRKYRALKKMLTPACYYVHSDTF